MAKLEVFLKRKQSTVWIRILVKIVVNLNVVIGLRENKLQYEIIIVTGKKLN